MIDWVLRVAKWHSKCNRLYVIRVWMTYRLAKWHSAFGVSFRHHFATPNAIGCMWFAYEWVTSHINMCHVTYPNPWVYPTALVCVSHIDKSHSKYIFVSRHVSEFMGASYSTGMCLTYEYVTIEIYVSRHMSESMGASCSIAMCFAYEWVMSHMNESYHTWVPHSIHSNPVLQDAPQISSSRCVLVGVACMNESLLVFVLCMNESSHKW